MGSKHIIIGTAGHIDHGKTTLIKALTGTDTDRLQEEKKRGISIDLGFTGLTLPKGMRVGIIDVPGHEKFIKNMLAGAGGVDLGLLIIAADEGVMPQTQEHLDILNLLNVQQGIVVVTKTDLVDQEWLELVIEDIRDRVKDSFLETAAIIPVSPITGEGLDELLAKTEELLELIPEKDEEGNIYFPIDRVFTLQGHGTVVTGTLIRGNIKKGETLTIYPAGIAARVRSMQVHENEVGQAWPGQRVGINLAGIATEDVERGHVLATTGSLQKTEYLDALLKLLPDLGFAIKHGDRIRLHLGAREIIGRVYLMDREQLEPGEKGLVQFKLEEEVVAYYRERFVLRRYSPMVTIGGGEILDSNPIRHRRFQKEVLAALESRIEGSCVDVIVTSLKLNKRHPMSVKEIVEKTGFASQQIVTELRGLQQDNQVLELQGGKENSWIHQDNYQRISQEIIEHLGKYHQKYHLRPGMPKEEVRSRISMELTTGELNFVLDKLVADNLLKVMNAQLVLFDFQVELNDREKRLQEEILKALQKNLFAPPGKEELSPAVSSKTADTKDVFEEVFNSLLASGKIIKLADGVVFHQEAVIKAERMLKEFFNGHQQIDMGEFRDLIRSSRKFALPLLEYFDKEGITRRIGNQRILVKE